MKQHLKACLIALSLTLCITPVVRALTITTFDPPDSIVTEVRAINNAGTIAGDFDDSSFVRRGYVRKADGTITTFDSPGSTSTFAGVVNISEKGKGGVWWIKCGDGPIHSTLISMKHIARFLKNSCYRAGIVKTNGKGRRGARWVKCGDGSIRFTHISM